MSGPIPARLDSAAKTLLLDLIDDAAKAGWTLARICGVLNSRYGPGLLGRLAPVRLGTSNVTGIGGVPATGVTSVVLNLTAVTPHRRHLRHRLAQRRTAAPGLEPQPAGR